MAQQDDDPFLDTEQVAQRIGVAPQSVRLYLKRTRKRVTDGRPLRPADFPLPDLTVRRSPAWRASTIDTWRAHRPGRGRRTPE